MRASLALLPSKKPTQASCLDLSLDHRIFPPSISPAFVHLISAIPHMSHLYLFISSCRSCIFPASLRVRRFHVPTDNIVLAILIFLSVADSRPNPDCSVGTADLVFPGDVRAGMNLVDSLASNFIRLFSLLPAHRHSSGRPFTCCIMFVFGMVRDSVPPVAARVRQPFSGFLLGLSTSRIGPRWYFGVSLRH